MKFTVFFLLSLFFLTSCVERGKVEVSGLEGASPRVTKVEVKNGKLHLKGSALHSAKRVQIDDTTLAIESQSEGSLVAKATEALSLTTSAVFELVISNAQGSTTYPIQLVISDGDVTTAKIADKAVTGDKIADMGAMSGQILKYNGTSWSPADLNSLVYAGTWDPNSGSNPSPSPVGGDFWIVEADGSYDTGDGNGVRQWRVGDWIVYNSVTGQWDQVISSQSVVSFNGRTGEVTPQANDYTWAQIDKSTAPIDDLSDVDTSTVAPTGGDILEWDGSNWVPGTDDDSGGDVTDVIGGVGLLDDSSTGAITLDVDTGTGANQIPQLNSSGELLTSVIPALDTSHITSGTFSLSRLPYASDTQDGIITASEHQKLNSTDTTLSGGAAGEYLDGDGNWYVLDNSAVGLGNVTNDAQIPLSNLDTTTTLGTSDTLVPSQNAVKTYVDNSVSTASNDYLLRDGTQAMTGNFDGGGNNLINVGSLTTSSQGSLILDPYSTASGNTSEIRFKELAANGVNYVGFKAPDAISSNLVWSLPASDGAAGEALVTDNAGNLSWASSLPPSGGASGELSGSYPGPTIADNVIDSANLMTDSVTAAKVAAGAIGTSEIATDGVDSAEIAASAVNTDELAASSVTSGKIADGEILDADVSTSADINASKLGTGIISNTEFNYLDGLTGGLQSQLDSKVDLAGDSMTGPLSVPANSFTVGTNQITTASGNVGIGTTSPQSLLHLDDASGDEGSPGMFIQDPTADNSHGGKVYFDDRGGLNTLKMSVMDAGTETGYIALDRTTGNVGIKTSAPSVELDVSGTMKLTKNSAAPYACDSSVDGAISMSNIYVTCTCRSGVGWVSTSDGRTSCPWNGWGIESFNGGRRWKDETYASSCNEYKNPAGDYNYVGSIGDGTYTIDIDGPAGQSPFNVYCDMTTDGGGWTRITASLARNTLSGSVSSIDGATFSWSGDSPRVRDGTGDHEYRYDFSFPGGFSEFYLDSFQVTAYADSGQSDVSEMGSPVIGDWGTRGGTPDDNSPSTGDLGFGSASDTGAAASWVNAGGDGFACAACSRSFPNSSIYTVGAGSTSFRMEWSEGGGEYEGWTIWTSGYIYLR